MVNTITKYGANGSVEVETRTSMEPSDMEPSDMEPSDMEPEDARQFIQDLMSGIHQRMHEMPDERFKPTGGYGGQVPNMERAKQYYGNDRYQLLSGIQAALREWDESGSNTEKLKKEYGGRFVDGVEIGERLAVHQGSNFTFTAGENDSDESESKFTFTQ